MKKSILKSVLGLTAMASLMLACGEAETILNQLLWSGSMMFICFASAKGWEALSTEEEKEGRV